MGSGFDVGECPSPSNQEETIFLHVTCNNGIDWVVLKELTVTEYIQPVYVSNNGHYLCYCTLITL